MCQEPVPRRSKQRRTRFFAQGQRRVVQSSPAPPLHSLRVTSLKSSWELVAWQEIARRRLPEAGPEIIPAGSSIKRCPEPVEGLPAPKDDRPTEETPAIEIGGAITDAQTGRPVAAHVLRRCQTEGADATTITSSYTASDQLTQGRRDPIFGGFAYHVPALYGGTVVPGRERMPEVCPGPGCIGRLALPNMSASDTGVTEIALQNLVSQPGLTNAAVFLYDKNGLLDILCETLNSQQLEYIDLATWGYINPSFKGSAMITATTWEHPVFDPAGQLKTTPVGLAGVIIERGHADAFDAPGDQSAGSLAFPVTTPFHPGDLTPPENFMLPECP